MTGIHEPFLNGLDLSEVLYREAVRPLLDQHFPDLAVSASLLGPGSEVLGFDTLQSTDHNWGPRLLLFLSEKDYAVYREPLDTVLKDELPPVIRGYPIDMARRDAAPSGEPTHHAVQILTVRLFFRSIVNVDIQQELTPLDWILIPQAQLRSVTAGRVFVDELGELEAAREKLAYYPRDVWLYLLGAQWMRISQEEHFVGRTGQVGDELGSRIVATRLVKDLMFLGFLMERQYAPYIKWFGTAFSHLDCARVLTPLFEQVLKAATWQERQAALALAYEQVARMHNSLGIGEPLSATVTPFWNRPFPVIWGERFFDAIHSQIRDPKVLALPPKLGGVDHFLDSTDAINFLNDEFESIKQAIIESL